MIVTCPTADAVQAIENKLQARIGPRRFQLWFKNSAKLSLDGERLQVQALNNYTAGWIENHFSQNLTEAARDVLAQDVIIDYKVCPDMKTDNEPVEVSPAANFTQGEVGPGSRKLNRKLRNNLESFVVGSGNAMAYSAVNSVVEKIISPFNPLFIHGGCGLGKTHLLQGLCNALSVRHPKVGWRYLSGEEFTNQFIVAVKAGALDGFRRQYRGVDVLVIDDVHFLANKRATQEEFLHTYNAISGAGKQLVMASDAHPKSIEQLNNSLVDRFISGMVVQIDPPDALVRAKIIESRARQLGHELPGPVIELISQRIAGNVRELEGAILKLIAYASLCSRPIGMDIAEKVVREYGHLEHGDIRISMIERKAAEYFGIGAGDIRGSKRTRTVALARAVAMYLARKHTAMSFPEIGKSMGKRNHSTVILACQKVEQLLRLDQEVTWDSENRVKTSRLTAVLGELEQQLQGA